MSVSRQKRPLRWRLRCLTPAAVAGIGSPAPVQFAPVLAVAPRHAVGRAGHGVGTVPATTDGYRPALRIMARLGPVAAPLLAVAVERVTFVANNRRALGMAGADAA